MTLTLETIVQMYIKVLGAEKVFSLCGFTREEILASLIKKGVSKKEILQSLFDKYPEEATQYLIDEYGRDQLLHVIDQIRRKQTESQ